MKTPGKPCASCPWRRVAGAADIPNFDLDLAEKLVDTRPDHRGMGPDFGASMFACHQSRQGEEFACAGWLAKVGHCHPAVRLAVTSGRLDPAALEPGVDWPALHESYQEVLDKLRETSNSEGGLNGDEQIVKIG
ncbi:DUF6283 family protein [Burkholderia sp. Ac-20344]|uniref:DUF6283 family protein n=1 Tax=Burkholderia sp. Ac-20344 TaxID=2703890 RepID=UPI00197C3F6A|nr:DUF6283 family protein [Burkholderia sp. Ac-20344]MBN3831906.1 hypothetical protein [Burkholderia sp. Ac-20344]